MNRKEATLIAVVGMAIFATVMATSSSTQALVQVQPIIQTKTKMVKIVLPKALTMMVKKPRMMVMQMTKTHLV